MKFHRVTFGISPPAPEGQPLDLVPGFSAIFDRSGKLLAIVDTFDRAVAYVNGLRRGPFGRTVRVVTYLAGDGEGQFHVSSRWRVDLELIPRRKQRWFPMEVHRSPRKKPNQQDKGNEP